MNHQYDIDYQKENDKEKQIILFFLTLHLSLIADTTDALRSSSTTGTGTNPESGADGADACCGRPGATAIGWLAKIKLGQRSVDSREGRKREERQSRRERDREREREKERERKRERQRERKGKSQIKEESMRGSAIARKEER